MLQRNKLDQVFSAKQWLLSGWGIYKQAPITWIFMILPFSIIYLIAMSSLPSRAVAALLAPVLLGGIYVAAFKVDNGESITLENLFSMFTDNQRLKQLLTIGGIGAVVVGLTYILENIGGSNIAMPSETSETVTNLRPTATPLTGTSLGHTLGSLLFWLWSMATIFSVPLIAITNQAAIESIKNSLVTALYNLIPLFLFFVCAAVLTILGIVPFGLGLLVVIPTLFCATYFIFKMIYLDGNDTAAAKTLNLTTPITAGSADVPPPGLVQKPPKDLGELLVQKVYEAQDKYDPNDRTNTSLPKEFTVNYFDDYMQITRTWASLKIIGLIFGAAIWNFVWISNDFLEILSSDRELLLKLFCLVFIVGGAFLIYYIIASALNKTEIYVNKNTIAIQHHPIPWPGNKTIEAKNIKQIYVKRIEKRRENRTYVSYGVSGLTFDDQNIKLLPGLKDFHSAHFVEKNIEDYLGIEDEEVAEEQRRPKRELI